MSTQPSRREALKTIAAVSAAVMIPRTIKAQEQSVLAVSREIEVHITAISKNTFRFTVLPINGKVGNVPNDGSLVRTDWGPPIAVLSGDVAEREIQCGVLGVRVTTNPLTLKISNANHDLLQRLKIDAHAGGVSFLSGDSRLFGLGEGGPQFDRRGSIDEMRSGQGGYKLATHGGRVPIPLVIGASGWAMFFHTPFGTFDLTGTE